MANQGGTGAHPQASFTTGELVVNDQVEQGTAGLRSTVLAHFTTEPVAGQQHIADAQNQDHQTERGKAEKAETGFTVAHQFTVHHHVGRCGDQAEHATDQTGETQRHHQTAG
ncbi:hypothetical protein D3C78_814610 [compost metagenome]